MSYVGNKPPCNGCKLSWRLSSSQQPIVRCEAHGTEYAPDRFGCIPKPKKAYSLPAASPTQPTE